MSDKLLSVQEAADLLGVSTKTLRRWDQRRILIPLRTDGGQRRYQKEKIEAFRISGKSLSKKAPAYHMPPALRITKPVRLKKPRGAEIKLRKSEILENLENLLTVQNAAYILGVSTKTLRRWDEDGILVSLRTIGGQRRYLRKQVETLRGERPNYIPKVPGLEIPIKVNRTHDKRISLSKIQTSILLSTVCIFVILGFVTVIKKTNFVIPDLIGNDRGVLKQAIKVNPREVGQKFGLQSDKGVVLGEATSNNGLFFNVNVPSTFNDASEFVKGLHAVQIATLSGGLITENQDVNAGLGRLTASNVVYGLTAGSGISVGTGQTPTITNTGVLSIGGKTGTVTLSAGSGISVSDLTITNSDKGSSQNIFKKITVGSSTIEPGSNSDTLTLTAGTGITLTPNTTSKTITVAGTSESGWTDDGTTVRLTTSTDSVGIGTTSPSTTLHVVGTSTFTSTSSFNGGVTLGDATSDTLTIYSRVTVGNDTTGNALEPTTGSKFDLGSSTRTWRRLYVDTLNVGSDTSISGTNEDDFRINADNATADTENSTLTFERGTPATNAALKWNATGTPSKLFSLNAPLFINPDTGISYSGTSALIVDQPQSQDIFTASASGTTRFRISNAGHVLPGADNSYDIGSSTLQWRNLYVAGQIFGGATGTQGHWQRASGAVSPANITDDLLLGATSTNSAKFAFLNVAGGTPTATISANSGNNAAFLTGLGVLATTNAQTLTLGNSSTGEVLLSPGGTLALTARGANLIAAGTLTGLTGLTSSGTITFSGFSSNGGPLYTNGSGVLSQTTAGTSTQVLHGGTAPSFSAVSLTADVSGVLPIANGGTNKALTLAAGAVAYSDSDSFELTAAGTSGQCLTSAGTGSPVWLNCALGSATNWWDSTNGAVYPINSTLDLLLGSTASTSAKFAVLNVNSGTPTASVSANSGNNAAFLTGLGNLATTNSQTLTLGGSTTGNITISPLNGGAGGILNLNTTNLQIAGTAGSTIGSASCVTTIDGIVTGSAACPAGETTVWWDQNNGALNPKNSTVDLLIGGTSTASAKFAVLNVNSGTPTASVSAGTAGGAYLNATGTLATTALQTLTLGSSTTTGNVILNPSGNIGIGTASPASGNKLHVEGQCVTGDTRLRRRRRKSKLEDEYIWDEIPIKDIQTGDEVLTLDETTGEFVPQVVENLMDMGIQDVFKMYTRSGLSIETTANHPYLVKLKDNKPETVPIGGTYEVDQSPKMEMLTQNSFIAVANQKEKYILKISKSIKKQLLAEFKSKELKNFAPLLFGKSIAVLIKLANISPDRLIIDKDFPGYDSLVEEMIIQSLPKVSIVFQSVGKNSPAHIAAFGFVSKKKKHKKTTVIPFEGTIAALHPEFHRDWPVVEAGFGVSPKGSSLPAHGLFSPFYDKKGSLSRGNILDDIKWIKVAYLKEGMLIATVNGWEPITKIFPSGHKQTYDIEIAQTHNFVGNEIVAHNTYINGNVGIGDTTPDALLDLDSTDTDGGDFLITNTGIGTSGTVAGITSNSTTTGDIFTISATGLTTGDAFKITGPSSTGITSGTSAGLVSIASDVGSAGTSGVLMYLAPDFSAGSATTGYGIYNAATDSTAIANTDYGYYGSLTLTGNAAKTGIGIYQTTTSSSTTADTLVSIDLATAVTGIMTTGTRNVYGIRNQPSAGSESTGGTTNVYGEYIKVAADVAAGGTVNGYGLYVANGTFDTDGTSTQYGLYVESPTGADTNYAGIFAGGNVGIGSTAPTDLLTLRSDSAGATTALLRLENLATATVSTGGGINFYANRTTGGSTNIIAMNGVITSIDNTNYQSRFDLRTAQAGALTTQVAVGGPNIQFNLPLDVNVGGDVGFNYDIMFLNTGTSYITSEGPLSILAGDPNHVENLTLGTQGTGDVVADINDAASTGGFKILGTSGYTFVANPGGTVGIGTTSPISELHVTRPLSFGATGKALAILDQIESQGILTASSSGTTIFTVTGGSGGDLLVGAAGANVTTNIGGNGVLAYGAICADDSLDTADDCIDASRTAGTVYGIASSFTIDDIAENFPTLDSSIEAGDVVSLNHQPKPDTPPSDPFEYNYETEFVEKSTVDSAMLGVISEKPGVLLGGYGQKTDPRSIKEVPVVLAGRVPVKVSIENGRIIHGDFLTSSSIKGVAMKATKPGHVIGMALENFDQDGIEKILVFVNLSWHDPDVYLTSTGDIGIRSRDGKYSLVNNSTNADISRAGAFSEIAAGNIRAGYIDAQALNIAGSINTDSLSIAGQSLKDYVASSSAQTYNLATDPLFKDSQDKVAALESKLGLLSQIVEQQASVSAFLAEIVNGQVLGVSTSSAALVKDLGNVDLNNATISGTLMVLGRTTVTDLGITGNINAGLLSINGFDSLPCTLTPSPLPKGEGEDEGCSRATINTLSGNLYLQNEGLGGIDILNGKIAIDTKGNLEVAGTITASKINIDTKDKEAASIGTGIIAASQTSVAISSPWATEKSKIFVTAITPTGKQSLFVKEKNAGAGFVVAIEQPYNKDITFDWWVVN